MAIGEKKLNLTKIVASGLFLLLFGAGIGYLDKMNQQQAEKLGASGQSASGVQTASFWSQSARSAPSRPAASESVPEREHSQYEFYSLLPEFNVVVPRPAPAQGLAQQAASEPAESAARPQRVVASTAPAPAASAEPVRPPPAAAVVARQAPVVRPEATAAAPRVSTNATEPEPPRSAPQPAVRRNRMYVQVGSFSRQPDAVYRTQQLRRLGIPSTILRTQIEGSDFYRVRIGPIDDQNLIDEVRNRLYSASIDHMVVR